MIVNFSKHAVIDFCNMKIHIGKRIKQLMEYRGMTAIVLANKINKSRENVYDIYNRESIDLSLLEKIGLALDYNFFEDLYNASIGNFNQSEPIKMADRLIDRSINIEDAIWKEKYVELLEKYASVLEENKRTPFNMPELKEG